MGNNVLSGSAHPKHVNHDHVAGSHPCAGRISTFAGQYTDFFSSCARNCAQFPEALTGHEVLEVHEDAVPDYFWPEVLAVAQEADAKSDADLKTVLMKVHRNLGHPPIHDLIRVLKHSQASDRALFLARTLECPVCIEQSQPKIALPAQTHRVTEFNKQIGIDVKYLTD